jgi:hypothetical protein
MTRRVPPALQLNPPPPQRVGARGAETMGWLAREAAGERLDELAREASLPAATVRQRVSRMRRWLRKRWLHEVSGRVVLVR